MRNYQEIKKSYQINFVLNLCRNVDLKNCPEVGEVLAMTNNDFLKSLFEAECNDYRDTISPLLLKNFRFLFKNWNFDNIKSDNFYKVCNLVSKLAPEHSEYFVSDAMFKKEGYLELYAAKYKKLYPIDSARAESIMDAADIEVNFDIGGFKHLKSKDIFINASDYESWLKKSCLFKLEDLRKLDVRDMSKLLEYIKDFASPKMYDYIYFVCAKELLDVLICDDIDNYPEIDKEIRNLYKKLPSPPTITNEVIKIFNGMRSGAKIPMKEFIKDVAEDPAHVFNYTKYVEESEFPDLMSKYREKYLSIAEKESLQKSVAATSKSKKFKL